MADILCGYTADRDETLVAYLYGDIDEAQRAAFEAHVETCERCRHELKELQGVRAGLQQWNPKPAVDRPVTARLQPMVASRSGGAARWRVLREVPAWAQVAAALLFLGVSARLAKLDVRYDNGGLSVRTGSSAAASSSAMSSGSSIRGGAGTNPVAPWRADLEALETRLRAGGRLSGPTGVTTREESAAAASSADAQLLRKVRALLDESERRQRNELALRIAEVAQEFDMKRGNDLANFRTLRNAQTATGVEIVRQGQYLDLLRQVSMQR